MDDSHTLKILIVYETLYDAVRATVMSQRLADQLQSSTEIKSDLWKFEPLAYPDAREEAANEAAAADMIIFATRGTAELPDHVKSWVASWMYRKRPGEAVLVALFDREEKFDGEVPRPLDYLQEIAKKAGMDFFCNTNEPPPPHFELESKSAADDPDFVSAGIDDAAPQYSGSREWGIND